MKVNFKQYWIFSFAVLLFIALIPSHTHAMTNGVSYQEAIAPKYEDAKGFSEGLAAVKMGGKWGYIDESGKLVIDFLYDDAHSFSEGKAIVEKYTQVEGSLVHHFYIITRNHQVVKVDTFYIENFGHVYKNNPRFHNNYVILPADSGYGSGIYDEHGTILDESYYSPTEGFLPKFNHYANADSEEYIALFEGLGYFDARPFNQGLAPVRFEEQNGKYDGYYSLLKTDGTLWSGPKIYDYYVKSINFDHILFNDFSLASVMDVNGKWGAVNKKGEIKIPFSYDKLGMFSDGLAAFSKNGKFGYIDINQNQVIEPKFDDVSMFVDGLANVREGANTYIINKQGEKIKGAENIHTASYFDYTQQDGLEITTGPNEFMIIEKSGKFGYIKKNGANQFDDYQTWTSLLEHDSVNHSWKVKLNMNINKDTVNLSNVYIVDNDLNRVDFVQPTVTKNGSTSTIILENQGAFKKGKTYWIIIESAVQSHNGKKLSNGLKAQFKIK